MSPHEIYEYFANGRGTELLDDAQDATRAEWRLEEHRAELMWAVPMPTRRACSSSPACPSPTLFNSAAMYAFDRSQVEDTNRSGHTTTATNHHTP